MSNMGYCRFRNTASDLQDCIDYMEDDLERDEHNGRVALIKRMVAALENIGADVDLSGVEPDLLERQK